MIEQSGPLGVPPELTVPPVPSKPKKQRRFHIWPRHWSTKKKRICTGVLAGVILLLIGGGVWYWHSHQSQPAKVVQLNPAPPEPTTVASPLTGVQVAPALAKLPVTGVMIENSPDARPQSGLKDAGVVYEAIAEGGITRFLALFQETQPSYVGPVRSARPYFIDWLLPFDAGYAHVGGSPEALAKIKSLHVKDIGQFGNPSAYNRISTRYSPHNMYTSIAKLNQVEKSKGYTKSNFTGFARKDEAKSATPTAKSIDFSLSGLLYNSHYDYDGTTNSYKRSEGGKPHVDERTKVQISPKVVIAMVMPHHLESDNHHNAYNTLGSGPVVVFQDGLATKGTWHKASSQTQFTFTGADGKPLLLNPGQTWITMIDNASSVTYK